MRVRVKPQTVSAISVVIAILSLVFAYTVWAAAGTTDSSSAPGSTTSYTLEDIYNSLNAGTAGTPRTFTEPEVAPGTGSMHTLNDLYALTRERAPVPRTGVTKCYSDDDFVACSGTGQDGDYQRGVTWPSPRFTDNGDGTVTDNLTGLIWLRNTNCFGNRAWQAALSAVHTLDSGECGLSDDSSAGEWRLPNVRELFSLIDHSQIYPALPSGHPFSGISSWQDEAPWTAPWGGDSYGVYWTSTSIMNGAAWQVWMELGVVFAAGYDDTLLVWPVRGGHGE